MRDGLRGAAMIGLRPLQPLGWLAPRGYANGLVGRQVGWDAEGRFAIGFVGQARLALANILAVPAEAGGGPEHVGRLTWYVVDMQEYRDSLAELGPAYRSAMGRHFPAMASVQVAALVEPAARLEIEATALLPD